MHRIEGNTVHGQASAIQAVIDASPQMTATFQAGRIFWGAIRDSVMLLRASGHRLDLEEGQGLLSRWFVLRGDADGVLKFHAWFKSLEDREDERR